DPVEKPALEIEGETEVVPRKPARVMFVEQFFRAVFQVIPLRIGFRQHGRFTLKPDEFGPLGLAVLLEPVREHQAMRVIVRLLEDRFQKAFPRPLAPLHSPASMMKGILAGVKARRTSRLRLIRLPCWCRLPEEAEDTHGRELDDLVGACKGGK